jgi:riboflavin biosynthesis pyrimidine reductase
MASQCLDAGLLDEVWVDLVPVILGGGTPFFSGLGTKPVVLEGPLSTEQGNAVTHLRYRVTSG